MKPRTTPPFFFVTLLVVGLTLSTAHAQTNSTQQLAFAGLRSVAQQGQINAVQSDSAGNLYLLLDQKDGVRLLKTDNTASTILAQALLGGSGDVGIALALDPTGNVYVTGTTSSKTLTATSGAAIPARTDASTNSFVAKFNPALNPLFVTFTGGSRIAAAAIAATSDAVFVTGITYATNLPVTPNGIQQSPALGSSQNGFVEKFSASGATLLYATYLTGATGDTTPAAIAADASDNAYIAGETTASGFPTIAALVPSILSNPSGFITRLDSAGDTITASTFIPGAGLSSLAIDPATQNLLVSGSVSLAQFPVASVATPLIPTTYQVLLRLPLSLNAVTASTLIAPGIQSSVAPAASGTAWVDGISTAPLFPLTPLSTLGGGYAVRVNAQNSIDQTARFGGLPNGNASFASLSATLTSVAVDPTGEPLIAGSMQPTASSTLLATETYDVPLINATTSAFPSAIHDAELSAATCNGSLCSGSAAYLARLNPNASAPSLTFSMDDLPLVTLRNLGSAQADGLVLSSSAATIFSNCGSTLSAGAECNLLLSGGSAGTLTASSASALQTVSFGAYTAPTGAIAFFPKELDFGIQTSTSPAATRTITVSNLGPTSQTFASAIDSTSRTASPFTEAASDCTFSGSIKTKVLAPGATCHITLALNAYSSTASDGLLQADWSIGARDVFLTGYSQAASLSASASEIDFGTQYTGGLRLPRYLYLSNPSANILFHAAVSAPAGSPFTVADACPPFLLAASVCRIRIDYVSPITSSNDSTTLALDQGLSVVLTGQTLPAQTVGGATVNPYLSVIPTSITFPNSVVVTSVSSAQTVAITNSGATAFSLTLALSGDFTDVTSCTSTLGAGQTCAVAISFAPSQPGVRQGMLSVTAGPGTSPAYVTLSGTATAILPANNSSLDFGAYPIGQPETRFYKIAQPFSALTVATSGPYSAVLVEDAGYGYGQPPAVSYASSFTGSCHNCYLGLRFTPGATGAQPGNLTLSSTAGGAPYTLALTGTGGALTGLLLTPVAQSFGSIPVDSAGGSVPFTLTNLLVSGTAAVLAPPTASGDFTLVPTTGQPCGTTLAYTASCLVQVAFVPTAIGSRSGSLTFTSGSTSVSAVLTGTGVADPGIAINPLALLYSNVPGASATQQTITLTNTGSSFAQVAAPTFTSASFSTATTCSTIAPAASCTITVTFQPGTALISDTLSIPVTTGVSPRTTLYTVALSGAYTASTVGIAITPAIAVYGPAIAGVQGPTRQFTVTNSTLRSYAIALNLPRQYVLVGPPCTALSPGTGCNLSLAFLPLTNGDIPGTLLAQATPGDGSATLTSIAYLEGYGTGQNTLNLSGGLIVNHVFNFGQVASGQALTQLFTLTNSNSSDAPPITVRRITSAPPFLSTTTCGSALPVGQSCTVSVTYAPSNQVSASASGPTLPITPLPTSDAGTLTIESDAASSPELLNFTGQGAPLVVASPSNPVTLATFTLSQSSLTFASTTVGNSSAPQSVNFTNTGTQAVHISSLTASTDFAVQNPCTTIVAGATCTFTVSSVPQTAGTHIAALQLSSDAATSLEFISLISTASPSPLVFNPTALNFGSLPVGSTAILPVTATNTGTTPIVFGSISASADYAVAGSCPAAGASLAPGTSCTAQISFTPSAAGTRSGLLSFVTSASTNPLSVPLTGTGTQSMLLISPSSLAFGNVAVGISANLQLTLANTGTAPINGINLAIIGDYIVSSPCASATLAPGASCSVQITFTPSLAGSRLATLTVTSSDASSPLSVPLTGTGIAAGGSFTLIAAPTSSTVISGQPAAYTLTVTPSGGFTGTVALTCTPLALAQYAACSLLPSSVTLAGAPQSSVVTINTITSSAALRPGTPFPGRIFRGAFLCLLCPSLVFLWRDRRSLRRHPLLLAAIFFCACALVGCGGGSTASKAATTLLYTPAGTYQFQVTAAATSGSVGTQALTLTLNVTAR